MGGIETMEQHKLLTDGNRNAAISLEDIIKEFTPSKIELSIIDK